MRLSVSTSTNGHSGAACQTSLTGTRVPRPAWKGLRCEQLNLQPTPPGSGYRGVDNGHNTSSWGGAVLPGPDGKYHMWAAEITEHCGISAWVQNSRVVRATSDHIGGPYERTQVVWEVFAHEPEVVPGPNGEYVMYFTANPRSTHGFCNCCRDNTGPCDGSTGPGDCPGGTDEGHSYMSHTVDPVNGNWSDPVQIFKDYDGAIRTSELLLLYLTAPAAVSNLACLNSDQLRVSEFTRRRHQLRARDSA